MIFMKVAVLGFVFGAMCFMGFEGGAAEPERTAAEAWKEVEKGHEKLRAPGGWREKQPSEEEVKAFQAELKVAAREMAEEAREFLRRFPEDEHAGDARF